jgi:SAM-dependent methyltransferase
MSPEDRRKQYPELHREKLVPVDVIDDGESLSTFADGSLDFIIANHFIEHARDPIGTIRNWLAKLKPGGIVYLAAPDARYTFDSARPLTSREHLLGDYGADESRRSELDHAHYLEYARLVDKKEGAEIEAHARHLSGIDYSIHFHTFDSRSFRELLDYVRDELHLPFEIRDHADTPPNGMEFLFILSKTAAPGKYSD